MGIEATSLVVETFFRSRDRDLGLQVWRQRPRSGQNELESRDHGLEITINMVASIPIGDRAFA